MNRKRAAANMTPERSNDSTVVEALHLLAVQYEQQGYFLHAIKALKAICSMDLLPATAAKYALRLAQLIMDHTKSPQEARKILENTQRSTAALPGFHSLKCEIHSALVKCYRLIGNIGGMVLTCQAAIDVCIQGASSSERDQLLRWHCHFCQQVACAHAVQDDDGQQNEQKATKSLEQGLAVACEHGLLDQQALCLLFKLQLHLQHWQKDDASGVIMQLHKMMQPEWPQQLQAFKLQALLHFKMLQVLYTIRAGRTSDLLKQPYMTDIDKLLPLVEENPVQYTWMPMPIVRALVLLLQASVLKITDKPQPCLDKVSAGLQLVEQQLVSMGMTDDTTEEDINGNVVWECRVVLTLRMLLMECRAQIHLCTCNYVEAQNDISTCAAIVDKYSVLLGAFRGCVHMLLGMYAHATGSPVEASSHYAAVRPPPDELPPPHCVPEVCTSVALEVMAVLASDDPNAVSYCTNLMTSIDDAATQQIGYNEKGSLKLAHAALKLKQAEQEPQEQEQARICTEAKNDLSRGLRYAHQYLGNHQMVAQVLTLLAPLQYGRGEDSSGAESMAHSAFTLSRTLGDAWSHASAAATAAKVFGKSAAGAQKVAEYRASGQRAQQKVHAAQQAALQRSELHASLLLWDLPAA